MAAWKHWFVSGTGFYPAWVQTCLVRETFLLPHELYCHCSIHGTCCVWGFLNTLNTGTTGGFHPQHLLMHFSNDAECRLHTPNPPRILLQLAVPSCLTKNHPRISTFLWKHRRMGAPLPRESWKLLRNHTQLEIHPSQNSGHTSLPKPPHFSEQMKGWVRVLLLHLVLNT